MTRIPRLLTAGSLVLVSGSAAAGPFEEVLRLIPVQFQSPVISFTNWARIRADEGLEGLTGQSPREERQGLLRSTTTRQAAPSAFGCPGSRCLPRSGVRTQLTTCGRPSSSSIASSRGRSSPRRACPWPRGPRTGVPRARGGRGGDERRAARGLNERQADPPSADGVPARHGLRHLSVDLPTVLGYRRAVSEAW